MTQPDRSARPPWRSFDEMLASYRSRTPEELQRQAARSSMTANDAHAQRELRHRVEIATKLSELGERFADRTLERFTVPPGSGSAKAAALALADEPESGGWFYGPPGTGKTHLAAGVMLRCVDRAVPATFTTATGLLDRLKYSYDKNNRLRGGEYDVIEWLSRVSVLVLDDIDKVEFTDRSKWAAQRIYALINRRYERRRPLIVTSNLSPAELALHWRSAGLDELIGTAILDRMREMCGRFVKVEGQSYRALRRAQ